MRRIIFYKLNGQMKAEEVLTKENLEHINGMMTRCTMANGTEEIGFADPTGICNKEIYDGKINEHIYLWTWDNLDENTGKLIGNDDEKYNQTFKAVKIDDIEKIEAIIHSNPRWGGKLTNKFEFYNNDINEKELDIPSFLKKENGDNSNENKEKAYYYLTVRYENYYSNKEYNYISDDTSIKVGDRVLVDMLGELVIADVLKTAFYNKFDAPFPVNKTKKIIQKVDENFDIADIECYYELDDEITNTIKMNVDDTYFEFGIFNYVHGQNNEDNWVGIKINVHNKNFNYFKKAELMTSAEVKYLLKRLEQLLDGKLKEEETIRFYEPDLEFTLYPKNDLCDTGKYAYIQEEYEQDIDMEFTINLTDREGTYIGQKYVIIFDRKEIEKIVEYMNKIMKL